MTITCPEQFHAAVQFAINSDLMLDAAIRTAKLTEAPELRKLEEKRGQAARTLLACFGYRANADAIDNRSPFFPEGSEIRLQDGQTHTAHDWKDRLPVRETFVFADMAQHSFFFREEWIDPYTRERVDVYDRCWYIFRDGRAQEVVDGFDESELPDMLGQEGVSRTFQADTAMKAATQPDTAVREAMSRRPGLCGGIIYHADYLPSGERAPYGSWSTHT